MLQFFAICGKQFSRTSLPTLRTAGTCQLWIGVIALFFTTLALPAQVIGSERKVALVIGNSAYENVPQLGNPLNDAEDIGTALQRNGFDVEFAKDVGIDGLRAALGNLAQRASDADVAVVYYAGHGIEVDSSNYLVPVDARLRDEAQIEFQTLSLEYAVNAVAPARTLSLVIVDACRDNPFLTHFRQSGATRSLGRGLARIEPRHSESLIAYAAAAGHLAEDGDGRNSPFARALIEALSDKPREVRLMMGHVRDRVMEMTDGRQRPYFYGSLGGTPVFLHAMDKALSADRVPQTDRSAEAKAAYQAARALRDPLALREVETFYTGTFWAKLAAREAKKLEDEQGQAVAALTDPKTDSALTSAVTQRPGAVILPDEPPEILAQRALKQLGLYGSSVDGIWGKGSARALRAFTGTVDGLSQEQELNDETLFGLLAATRPLPNAGADVEDLQSFKECDACPDMVIIPGGRVRIGSPVAEANRDIDEGPETSVFVTRFAMARTEITKKNWAACVSDGQCRDIIGGTQHRDVPATNMTWHDAQEYVTWLNRRSRTRGYRLPTEAEWEYAARGGGGTLSEMQNRAHFSKVPGEKSGPAPSGSLPSTAWGLHDLLGNVWEWTESCKSDDYRGLNPRGVGLNDSDCAQVMLRGGSWIDGPSEIRPAERTANPKDYNAPWIGFRVVRQLPIVRAEVPDLSLNLEN